MQRIAQLISLRPEAAAEYRELHAAVWPEVLATIEACGIRNYSIFLREPEHLLIAYFEYHGDDWEADQAKMAADPATQRWWQLTEPQQQPLQTRSEGQWWADTTEVFHTD